MLGVEAILAAAIGRDRTGCRRVSHQRPAGCAHVGQTRHRRARAHRKWIVSTGVQNDEIDPITCALHLLQHHVGVDRVIGHFVFVADVGIGGHQKVLAPHLHAVASKVEQPDATSGLQLVAKIAHQAAHIANGSVFGLDNGKARLLQGHLHEAHIIDRVDQR